MTNSEQIADERLSFAKLNVKHAFNEVDPSPADPLAIALLKALDSIDEALKLLRRASFCARVRCSKVSPSGIASGRQGGN